MIIETTEDVIKFFGLLYVFAFGAGVFRAESNYRKEKEDFVSEQNKQQQIVQTAPSRVKSYEEGLAKGFGTYGIIVGSLSAGLSAAYIIDDKLRRQRS